MRRVRAQLLNLEADADVTPALRRRVGTDPVHLREVLSNFSAPLKSLVKRLEAPLDHGRTASERHPVSSDKARLQLLQVNHKLHPDEVEQLARAYRSGQSIVSLSRMFGLHKQTVRAHLVRNGIQLRRVRVLTKEQITEAAELYRQGWSTFRLAARYDVGATTIARNLKRAGVKLRPRWWAGPE